MRASGLGAVSIFPSIPAACVGGSSSVRALQRGCPVIVRPRSAAGFSLLELMIVLVIIGTMSALVMPGLSEYLADTRASGAAEDVVRVLRRTRARVQETGLAHWVEFSATQSNNLGAISVWEGMNNHCMQTPWAAVKAAYASGTNLQFAPVETLDLGSSLYNPVGGGVAPDAADTDRFVIQLWAEQPALNTDLAAEDLTIIQQGGRRASWLASAGICFQPNGQTYQGGATTMAPHVLPFVFRVVRFMNGNARGMVRHVVVGPGGTARARL
jgi:prepilin-type N-terminal cleavage/methylation domain-containing protein